MVAMNDHESVESKATGNTNYSEEAVSATVTVQPFGFCRNR